MLKPLLFFQQAELRHNEITHGKEKKIKVLRTDQEGDIEVVSDGKSWLVSN